MDKTIIQLTDDGVKERFNLLLPHLSSQFWIYNQHELYITDPRSLPKGGLAGRGATQVWVLVETALVSKREIEWQVWKNIQSPGIALFSPYSEVLSLGDSWASSPNGLIIALDRQVYSLPQYLYLGS